MAIHGVPKDGGAPAQPKGGGTSSIFNPGNGNSVPAITGTGGGAGGVGGGFGGDGGSGGGHRIQDHMMRRVIPGNEPRANPTSEETIRNQQSRHWNPLSCGGGGGTDIQSTLAEWTQNYLLCGYPGDPWALRKYIWWWGRWII